MLSNVDVAQWFWAKVVATIVHLINRSPNKILDKEQVIVEMIWSDRHHTIISKYLVAKRIVRFLGNSR